MQTSLSDHLIEGCNQFRLFEKCGESERKLGCGQGSVLEMLLKLEIENNFSRLCPLGLGGSLAFHSKLMVYSWFLTDFS